MENGKKAAREKKWKNSADEKKNGNYARMRSENEKNNREQHRYFCNQMPNNQTQLTKPIYGIELEAALTQRHKKNGDRDCESVREKE